MQELNNHDIAGFAKRFDAIRTLRNPVDFSEQHRFALTDIKKNGFLDLEGTLYLVQDVFEYEERNKQGKTVCKWKELELFAIESGDIRYLEYEVDDGLEISVTEKELKLRELGTTMEQIRSIADKEDGEIFFNETAYYYEDDYKAYFVKNGEEHEVILYEFESENHQYITIEAWGGENDDYEVFLSLPIQERSIVLVALGS
ncbi:DUF4178 domain-containing protein [Sulfuricurvum sp.]|uniref:DUF4178 domain-containing protein n=1 Tax=Sulfuricurvum sp. TaxID=2025608 RepID=UPI002613E910|nr:DUF4178 domain-containing protein [Sulfuricurvum sp.]MDD4883291.1 DUF4178 domain-containing protein [Sulfuricurvum sp.]